MGKLPNPESESEENDSDYGEDMLEMIEEDDLEFIKNAITSKSYNIFNKVRYTGTSAPKPKKRKLNDEDSDLENEYEDQTADDVPMKNLLPIKTKQGIVRQQIEDKSASESEEEEEVDENEAVEAEENQEEQYDFVDDKIDISKPISAAQLLVERNKVLKQKKLHIGTLSAGVLENPEEKVTNLRTLIQLMDDNAPEVYFTVRKLATVSLLEVFKDVLPSYEIKKIDSEGVKLKKDTLKLQKYEETLLLYYKKFLQKLEKSSSILIKKKGDNRAFDEEIIKLGELGVQSLCDLLVTHPYFNFSQNIAQAVVPFLNNPRKNIREIAKNAIKTVFKEDKKEEITLKILRIINHYVKNRAHNVHPDILETLLVLNLKDVNLDEEKEQDIKQKKLMARKQKVLQMSKRERKRKKRLQLLEKELLETKAEENKQTKQQNLTEITKFVFGIYFRILKSSTNTKVLGVCLEGLAKFAHCINLEFYLDLVNILDRLMKEEWLGYREQLHCVQTVFSILSGQGEALNIDPTRFYVTLYKNLLVTHASKNYSNFLIVLKTLNDALIKRRKKITNKRTISFVKRLATLSLQLLHNGALGSLSLIKTTMQMSRSVDVLLDLDTSFGDGKFQPELEDPEYSNASSTALYELILLTKHYHPVVAKYAKNIAHGVPASGEGSLDPEYAKCTAEQLYNDFDMSEMAFNPAVPVPRKNAPKAKSRGHLFADGSFESQCKEVVRNHLKRRGGLL
ncbi:nucleolar complex protein 3 isoform X2 [Tenebrio molitor]|uniref:nucleolar complex protein 3 isoform X2 n=1 Tax=Tenebrio molitor TaxID=7067 RepID=UPI00362494CC